SVHRALQGRAELRSLQSVQSRQRARNRSHLWPARLRHPDSQAVQGRDCSLADVWWQPFVWLAEVCGRGTADPVIVSAELLVGYRSRADSGPDEQRTPLSNPNWRSG